MGNQDKFQQSISGKTVVVTGASSGVGLAAAEAFSIEGCNVVIVARGEKGINEAVKRCKEIGGEVVGISADVSVAAHVEKITTETLHHFGKIDVWINNAGVMANGKFEEIPMEIHEQVIKTNLFGYMHGAYNALKVFKNQNEGILINNVSIGGYMPAPYSSVYSSTKYGIKGMMEGLQAEVSNLKNIHICNIYPQLQNSTGNLHSAKYSGFKMSISSLASDPRATAETMVKLVRNPRTDVFPDFSSKAITMMYRIFPKPFNYVAATLVRIMMKVKNGPQVEGNVLQQSNEPLRVYGRPELKNTKSNVKKAALIGVGIGLALVFLNKKSKK